MLRRNIARVTSHPRIAHMKHKRIISSALVLGALAASLSCGERPEDVESVSVEVTPYFAAAIQAGNWIRSTAIDSEAGRAWPADPLDTATVVTNLYTGTPGVVLFFLELASHTGDVGYLDDARAGADYLLARLVADPSPGEDGAVVDATVQSAGLYTGVAGVGFALHQTYRATGEAKYLAGAERAVAAIHAQAREHDAGVDWIDSTDIVSGAAGTGLFLLYAAREMGDAASLELAESAGRLLLTQAEEGEGGASWRINADYPRVMPNFSHGTAGVAYYMAALYEATGEVAFLDAATSGARQLLALAETEGDICLVFHHSPDGENLQYLSWCHGPAGTARTFYKLYELTGDPEWMDWVRRSANGVYQSGVPEQLTEGFWNNVGQCCGSAGVAEFSLAMHRLTADREHLGFAQRVADDLLARATVSPEGLMWVQAENRVQPDFLVAQTGYMQGAAGIGILLLHMDAAVRGEPHQGIVFPDAPY
ncbi:MAG: lantibiotic modifying-like protein [Acidobacteria bacterium]|nr:lantibiotic modifying-like protein [Acidobacteriota bacterium]